LRSCHGFGIPGAESHCRCRCRCRCRLPPMAYARQESTQVLQLYDSLICSFSSPPAGFHQLLLQGVFNFFNTSCLSFYLVSENSHMPPRKIISADSTTADIFTSKVHCYSEELGYIPNTQCLGKTDAITGETIDLSPSSSSVF
jgi:hypothetical protein